MHFSNLLLTPSFAQYDSPKLLAAIDTQAHRLISKGKPQEIANTALAFATLNTPAPNFWAHLEQQQHADFLNFRTQHICNTAWALAIGGYAEERRALLRDLWSKAMATGAEEFNRDELNQLLQVGLHAEAEGVKLGKVPKELQERMLEAAKDTDNYGTTVRPTPRERSELDDGDRRARRLK